MIKLNKNDITKVANKTVDAQTMHLYNRITELQNELAIIKSNVNDVPQTFVDVTSSVDNISSLISELKELIIKSTAKKHFTFSVERDSDKLIKRIFVDESDKDCIK